MTVGVLQFGGSNCDRDTVIALSYLGIDAERVWYKDEVPGDITGVVLPGGFSYGDYLRAGAMAARTPIIDQVKTQAKDGLPLLGICNGAQIGCEAGLIPGTFTVNNTARFRCEHVFLRVENDTTRWTREYTAGDVIELPIAHGEGRFEIQDDALEGLEQENRVLFRYCDSEGNVTAAANPNGSKGNVAGILGESENVAVLMPHPERATMPDLGLTDGQGILTGFNERYSEVT